LVPDEKGAPPVRPEVADAGLNSYLPFVGFD
jgi:hypothetical protein